MNPSESDRMFLLERRLQEMEAALQGERPRISTAPQAESQAFRRSSSPEPTQHTQSRSLARQGALMDIPIHRETPSQQARLNRGAIGAIDSRALVPISARYEHGLPQVQTCSQPNQGSPQSYQPFLGLQSLSPNPVSTSHVNQARRASAATMIQRRQNTRARLEVLGERRHLVLHEDSLEQPILRNPAIRRITESVCRSVYIPPM